ncbi:hypothetical protein PJL15_03368 [Paenarthrobacter nitroguajacolicus]|nr:hypothetical protein [Paenarthrobacter nitroguajacolicus]
MPLDRIEQSLEQGPCIDALESGRPILLEDSSSLPRWADSCGIIISQNSCSHEEAFHMLKKASNDRNQKLRDLAHASVEGVADRQPQRSPG